MQDLITNLLREVLNRPEDALSYELSIRVREIFPSKFVLETEDSNFELDDYIERGGCCVRLDRLAHSQLEATWKGRAKGGRFEARNALYDVQWNGERLKVLTITYDYSPRHYIVASNAVLAKRFFSAVCTAHSQVSGQILVFSGGSFRKDKDLIQSISSANFENLVLAEDVYAALIDDFQGFFEAETLYASHGVAWKRGLLLLGPPGNGKTHAIKAMVNRLQKPCLYVRSFKSSRSTVHAMIQAVFRRAREIAPCILVLEDLDSLVDSKNRSFFLNEMDGFALNHGVLTVATTNHPEKLDPALLERPSRFDRKITFDLPVQEERKRFLELMLVVPNEGNSYSVTAEEFEELATATEEFSFAYLKELCLSGIMAWMRPSTSERLAVTMLQQVETLRKQMKTEPPAPVHDEDDDEEDGD